MLDLQIGLAKRIIFTLWDRKLISIVSTPNGHSCGIMALRLLRKVNNENARPIFRVVGVVGKISTDFFFSLSLSQYYISTTS